MPFSGLREIDGARVFYAKAYWPGRYFFAPQVVPVIRSWSSHADVVHVHDARTFVGLAAYMTATSRMKAYILTCHGSLSRAVGDTLLKALHDHLVGRGLVRRASKIIALNELERQEILEFGVPSDKVVVVPNSIPVPEQMPPNLSKASDIVPGRPRIVLYIGRIHPIKGLDRLIDAFALIKPQAENYRLLLVGQDYGAQKSLMQRIRERELTGSIEFLGPRYGSEKDRILQSADVFVLPSYKETFPLVVLEAFAGGLPVVTTAGCGIADQLRRSKAALVVSSTAEMANAISQCLHDRVLSRQVAEAGFRLLQTEYNWDRVLSRILDIYREVAS